ncbi:MAG: hypothetical protein GX034_00290 [Clostridiaceae bacterium]|nr:hypothetical protein [Clostridiaceae bacterium]
MNSRSKSRYMIRKRCLSLILLLALTGSLFLSSACSLLEFGTSERTEKVDKELFIEPENGEYLNEVETVHTLILAMNNTDKIESIWRHIPSKQRSEINLSLFVSYIRILKQVLQNTVVSFSEATVEESAALRLNISRSVPALTDEADRSSFWYINTQGNNNQQERFAISINNTEDGIPYFSSAWVAKQAFLYDYIRLYFSALEEGSPSALFGLLHQQINPNIAAYEQAVESRVTALLSYYGEFSNLQLRSYRVVELMPGNARVVQSNLPDGVGSRTVSFRENNAVISINERIPQVLDLSDTEIHHQGKLSFRLESATRRLMSSTSLSALGIPLDIRLLSEDDADTGIITQGNEVNFRVIWPGIQIDAFGSFNIDKQYFDGVIKRIDIFYTDYETGSGLRVGDPINLLYIKYPFARENDYLIRGESNGVDLTLAVQVESDYIARLTILSEEAPLP